MRGSALKSFINFGSVMRRKCAILSTDLVRYILGIENTVELESDQGFD